MNDSGQNDTRTAVPAADAAGCTSGPKVTLESGLYKDEARGFEFTIPAGFTVLDSACGLYPALVQTSPGENRPPRRVDIFATEGAFQPRALERSTSSGGVGYYLVAGMGQETGQVSEWNLVVPGSNFFLTLQTDKEGKALLELIAGGFRWTR